MNRESLSAVHSKGLSGALSKLDPLNRRSAAERIASLPVAAWREMIGDRVLLTSSESKIHPESLEKCSYEPVCIQIAVHSTCRDYFFNRLLRWRQQQRRKRNGKFSHYTYGHRHAGSFQHQFGADSCRHRFRLQLQKRADRVGDPLQRQLCVVRHLAQLRFGDDHDSGRGAGRRLRHADRQVHSGQRKHRSL